MGESSSKKEFAWVYRINNDYELAIRLSKELEYILVKHFNADGKGLHQRITSAEENYNNNNIQMKRNKKYNKFPKHLIRNMRRLATIRNKLIHEKDFNKINDRERFIQTFEQSYLALQSMIDSNSNTNNNSDDCIIL